MTDSDDPAARAPGDKPKAPLVPISWGELLDKITIPKIKLAHLTAAEALANVENEHRQLSEIAAGIDQDPAAVDRLKSALKDVNQQLWRIEDDIREKEARGEFDQAFIELARAVYRTNDERGRIKREINELLRSELVEEKQYASY